MGPPKRACFLRHLWRLSPGKSLTCFSGVAPRSDFLIPGKIRIEEVAHRASGPTLSDRTFVIAAQDVCRIVEDRARAGGAQILFGKSAAQHADDPDARAAGRDDVIRRI